jgi:hypothetical protein
VKPVLRINIAGCSLRLKFKRRYFSFSRDTPSLRHSVSIKAELTSS